MVDFFKYLLYCASIFISAAIGESTDASWKDYWVGILVYIVVFLLFLLIYVIIRKRMK